MTFIFIKYYHVTNKKLKLRYLLIFFQNIEYALLNRTKITYYDFKVKTDQKRN